MSQLKAQVRPGSEYLVVDDVMIIDAVSREMAAQAELGEVEGVSLNRLHLLLNRERAGPGRRINYYKLKASLARLTGLGLLEEVEHTAKKAFFGRSRWPLWRVVDWASRQGFDA